MKRAQTIILILLHVLISMFPGYAQQETAISEWPSYGRDPGGSRFVPIKQIDTLNVAGLQEAWRFRTGELETYEDGSDAPEKAAFEATPLMVGGVLYFSTPSSRVFAIDALTGKQKWLFDYRIKRGVDYSEITSRGVSYWPLGDSPSPEKPRVFVGTLDGKLIALDASKGQPIIDFGKKGIVDLQKGFGERWSITSPPAIIGNLIIVGSSMGDNQRIDYPKGTVRAYDVLSGELKWSWDPKPDNPGDPAYKTWSGSSKTGAANAWAPLSVDAARGLVFVPTASPAPDYYGGERLGDNRYANSIVALRAATGKVVWHFQTVHHDLWDYDIAAQPLLFDFPKDGGTIPAVAVGTKMGHVFIFNRETGEPLFPIEERLVPASKVSGEIASKTQPFPVLPKPLGLQIFTKEDVWGITPDDSIEAKKRVDSLEHYGIFTPPSLKGSLITPGNVGGINWSGMSYDARQNLLITNINRFPAIIKLIPRKEFEATETSGERLQQEVGRQEGTPYVLLRSYLMKIDSQGRKLQSRPPWGTLLAIDMATGDKKWEVPLGFSADTAQVPKAKEWGSISLGGTIATAGGLTFVAGTLDSHLRAFKTSSGEELWEMKLPAGGQATPMSYAINGRQFVVISAGGHGKIGTPLGDYVIAYALP